eukprot:INCI1850.1.p1 GENE.INCI1850.1~~INCI1850.1.p1  ORF type:complete len:306 (+),score=61.70 INCI1850.1:111-1028(+)
MDLDSLESCVKRHLRTLVLSPVAENSAQRTECICRAAAGLIFADTRCTDTTSFVSPAPCLDSAHSESNSQSSDYVAVQELLKELADPGSHSPDSRWQVAAILCLDLLAFQKQGFECSASSGATEATNFRPESCTKEELDVNILAFVGREFFQLFLEELPHVVSVVQVAQEILNFSARIPAWRLSLLWFIWQSFRAMRLERKVFGLVELAAIVGDNVARWPWIRVSAGSALTAERKESTPQQHLCTSADRVDAMEGLLLQLVGELDDAIQDMPQVEQELQGLRDALANHCHCDGATSTFLEAEDNT